MCSKRYFAGSVGCDVLHVLELAAAGYDADEIPGAARRGIVGGIQEQMEAVDALQWMMRTADGILGELVRGGSSTPFRHVPVLVEGFNAWRSREEVVAERVGEEVTA